MYTQKNYKKDLVWISTTYFVKYKLLQDFVNNRIDHDAFVEELEIEYLKEDAEITEIIGELRKLSEKIKQNGGKLDLDPVDEAKKQKKNGKQQEAFDTILPYLQEHRDDEEAVITFGWIMYDFLKMSEGSMDNYVENLKILNDNAAIPFDYTIDFKKKLVTTILWSIRRVVLRGEQFANKVFPQLLRLIGNESKFIENRRFNKDNEASISRLLIKEIRNKLSDKNYLMFMDAIGFNWFDKIDFQNTDFTNANGEQVVVRPLAEVVLNYHAKKLLSMDVSMASEQRINSFIEVLNTQIKDNPSFEWLPYYNAKLLIKVNRKEEALNAVTLFARTKSKEFWIWDLISDIVNEDETFNCLCAGLVCKAKPEMIVGLQERIIPLLVKKGMFSNAKFELDLLISTRMKKWGKISRGLEEWKNESWYVKAQSAESRVALEVYADQAEEILFRTLPFTDIFVTYINEEKGVIHFAYMENKYLSTIKDGYFFIDSLKEIRNWKIDESLKVRMIKNAKRTNLYRIYKIEPGDETFASNFIQIGSGYVNKQIGNSFAFVNDVFISPKLVEENKIEDYDNIEYIKRRRFNRKKNKWGWTVEKITSIEREEQAEDNDEE
ncbi:hypothetical protein SFC66_12435 [Terribacillus saccharophilus]|uniref:DUF7017 domain-containing protein n=1 Tax=Terribacillus saccharophilus TaxID=361277 RepID=UPI003981DF1F